MNKIRYFLSSFIFSFIAIALIIYIEPNHKLKAACIVVMLAILEVALSFDNAIINARILKNMSEFWQKMFIWIGMPIAVFGMRLLFPLLLVSLTSSYSLIQVFDLATKHPDAYQIALEHSMPIISSFGAGFLIMVFFKFFVAESHSVSWFKLFEKNIIIRKLNIYRGGYLLIPIAIALFLYKFAPHENHSSIVFAYLAGILVHELLGFLNNMLNSNAVQHGKNLAKSGLMAFLYLEVLDASFSMDGVIGAFAITKNILIIMIGLGIGAMFVRSLTLYFVKNDTLSKFKYIEHGAHYTIGILSLVMISKLYIEIPEWLIAGSCILVILLSLIKKQSPE